MNDEIRSIYGELLGYLQQMPEPESPFDEFKNERIWERVNEAIEELNKISVGNYEKFKINPLRNETRHYEYVNVREFRVALGGLINKLHSEYFSEEPGPFSGSPSTIITQQQTQEQSVLINIILEIQSKMDEKYYKSEISPEEKSYIEVIKSQLSSITSFVQLISLIIGTAKEVGLNLDQLMQIFS